MVRRRTAFAVSLIAGLGSLSACGDAGSKPSEEVATYGHHSDNAMPERASTLSGLNRLAVTEIKDSATGDLYSVRIGAAWTSEDAASPQFAAAGQSTNDVG